jgi:hypothetical protein
MYIHVYIYVYQGVANYSNKYIYIHVRIHIIYACSNIVTFLIGNNIRTPTTGRGIISKAQSSMLITSWKAIFVKSSPIFPTYMCTYIHKYEYIHIHIHLYIYIYIYKQIRTNIIVHDIRIWLKWEPILSRHLYYNTEIG